MARNIKRLKQNYSFLWHLRDNFMNPKSLIWTMFHGYLQNFNDIIYLNKLLVINIHVILFVTFKVQSQLVTEK